MKKHTTFTSITPLPASISRASALSFLHNHLAMIDLNPLIIARHPIPPPTHALPDELQCRWFSLTDRITPLPGLPSSTVSYTCAFHDLPDGVQTHCHAPLGLDIRERWTVGGTVPGEPRAPVELGLGAPAEGLYIREDVDMRCNVLLVGFVRKTLQKAHAELVRAMVARAGNAVVGVAELEGRGAPEGDGIC